MGQIVYFYHSVNTPYQNLHKRIVCLRDKAAYFYEIVTVGIFLGVSIWCAISMKV